MGTEIGKKSVNPHGEKTNTVVTETLNDLCKLLCGAAVVKYLTAITTRSQMLNSQSQCASQSTER